MAVTISPSGIGAADREAHVGSSAPTINATLLFPQFRITRAPLGAWAERITNRLVRWRTEVRTPRESSELFVTAASNAALIAAHAGSPDVARRLCEQQLQWQCWFSRRVRDPAITGRVIQPWINLGRLDALSGVWQAALVRFAQLRALRTGELRLRTIRVDGTAWQLIRRTPEAFERALENAIIVESLKALLLNRRFEEVRAFVSRTRAMNRVQPVRRADEALIIALCRLHEYGRAEGVARSALRSVRGWEHVVFRLRLAEVLASTGDTRQAVIAVRPVLAAMQALSPRAKREGQVLYLVHGIAKFCMGIGLTDDACLLARDLYVGAQAAGDEVFQMESVRLLAIVDQPDERERWRYVLHRMEESTAYVRFRRGTQQPATDPAIARMYAEFDDILAER